MTYDIIIKAEFSAAHKVQLHEGEKESLHGHNWLVEACISAEKLDENGMVVDFIKTRELLKTVLAELDHHNLNEIAVFADKNPTAERIACFIFEEFEKLVKGLVRITVWETPSCAATYSKRL